MEKNKIDITMPTTLRPGILDKTLKSFTSNVFTDKDRYRFIFNIDPIGENCNQEDVVKIVNKYFDNILYNMAEEPSFPKAFKWCWDQVEADFVFHMNEDWELLRPININNMINILKENKNLSCLRLLKMDVPNNLKFFRSKYIDMNKYLKAERREESFGTNPELIRAEFVKEARKFLRNDYNPEKQFRSQFPEMFKNVVMRWDYAVYALPGDKALIKDIGEKWKEKMKFRKKKGQHFTTWEEIK
jgi:hypothetical protein